MWNKIINHRKIYYVFSGLLTICSLFFFFVYGLNYGIDFTGGSLLELKFVGIEAPSSDEIRNNLTALNLGYIEVKSTDNGQIILRAQNLNNDQRKAVVSSLNDYLNTKKLGTVSPSDSEEKKTEENKKENSAETIKLNLIEEIRYESIGPIIGQELKSKTIMAVILVNIFIILYISWAFRHASKPVASWKYGVIAVIALIHDVLMVVGCFALFRLEVNAPFVVAILTTLGYSVNDTIVIFDRVRENLFRDNSSFENIVNRSLAETIWRSFATTFTTVLPLFAILFLGGNTIRDFILALIVGISSGAYSSIFIASPLLVSWYNWQEKKKNQ